MNRRMRRACEERRLQARNVYQMANRGTIGGWGDGFTYILEVPGELLKIGYTGREETLMQRMTAAGKKFGYPLELVSLLHGGEVLENYLHGKFEKHRMLSDVNTELFDAHELIYDWINQVLREPQTVGGKYQICQAKEEYLTYNTKVRYLNLEHQLENTQRPQMVVSSKPSPCSHRASPFCRRKRCLEKRDEE